MSSQPSNTDPGTNPPTAIRRIVTGHDPKGTSIVLEDKPIEPRPFPGAPGFFTDLYWTDSFPSDNVTGPNLEFKDLVKDHPTDLVSPEGSSFRVAWMPPGLSSPFHRTITIDYGIVMQGTLTLVLDNNKRLVLHPGDVIIQRGTIHAWVNEGTEWTKVYFILLPSQKVKIGDTELETEFREL